MLYPYSEIRNEQLRQLDKWGVQSHSPERWLTILTEEVGEVAKAILEENSLEYKEELIQVAATVVTMLEAFHTQSLKRKYS